MSDFRIFTFAAILFVSIVLLFLTQLLIRFTLDRRVRKALPANKQYDFVTDWYFGYGRSICFGYAACFDWANNSWVIKDYYDGFDIKNFASPTEKIMGFIMSMSILTLILSTFFYYVTKWTGLLLWE